MTISVVIPAWNAERHLAAALDSVFGQTLSPDEVIVIDDGSQDRTGEVALAYAPKVTCHSQANAGIAAARNAGLQVATGDFIALLDADDVWQPDKLALQKALLDERPDLAAAFCLLDEFLSDVPGDQSPSGAVPRLGATALLASGLLVRADALRATGLFDREFSVGEFIDWFARFEDAGYAYGVVPKVLLRRRLHGSNTGIVRRKDYQREFLRVLKRTRDRRRQSGA